VTLRASSGSNIGRLPARATDDRLLKWLLNPEADLFAGAVYRDPPDITSPWGRNPQCPGRQVYEDGCEARRAIWRSWHRCDYDLVLYAHYRRAPVWARHEVNRLTFVINQLDDKVV